LSGCRGPKGSQSVCLPPCPPSLPWRAIDTTGPSSSVLALLVIHCARPPVAFCCVPERNSLRVMGWAVSTAAVTHATRVRRRIQVGACLHRSVTCRRRSARRRDGDAEHTSGTRTLQRSSSLPAGRPSSSRREAPAAGQGSARAHWLAVTAGHERTGEPAAVGDSRKGCGECSTAHACRAAGRWVPACPALPASP
jgi:hypothetical protein